MAALSDPPLIIRYLDCCEYSVTFDAMKTFTMARDKNTSDEIWLLEHFPVFTQGQAGKPEYILSAGDIPVIQSDRGGHVTYHGPGQVTAYLLIDLRRLGIDIRHLVDLIELSIIQTLDHWGISAVSRRDAPGVYLRCDQDAGWVQGAKIASLGLRIKRGCSYHGLNFNVAMDLEPWHRINPCGLGVAMTQVSDLLDSPPSVIAVAEYLADMLTANLGYNCYRTEYHLASH